MQFSQMIIQLLKEMKDTIVAGNGACNEKLLTTLHDIHRKYDSVVKSGAIMDGESIASNNNLHMSSFFFGIITASILISMYQMYRNNQLPEVVENVKDVVDVEDSGDEKQI